MRTAFTCGFQDSLLSIITPKHFDCSLNCIEDSPYFMSLIGPIKGVADISIAVVLLSCNVRLFR